MLDASAHGAELAGEEGSSPSSANVRRHQNFLQDSDRSKHEHDSNAFGTSDAARGGAATAGGATLFTPDSPAPVGVADWQRCRLGQRLDVVVVVAITGLIPTQIENVKQALRRHRDMYAGTSASVQLHVLAHGVVGTQCHVSHYTSPSLDRVAAFVERLHTPRGAWSGSGDSAAAPLQRETNVLHALAALHRDPGGRTRLALDRRVLCFVVTGVGPYGASGLITPEHKAQVESERSALRSLGLVADGSNVHARDVIRRIAQKRGGRITLVPVLSNVGGVCSDFYAEAARSTRGLLLRTSRPQSGADDKLCHVLATLLGSTWRLSAGLDAGELPAAFEGYDALCDLRVALPECVCALLTSRTSLLKADPCQAPQPVDIQGVPGLVGPSINGTFLPTELRFGGAPVYRKEGLGSTWLAYDADIRRWLVQVAEENEVDGGVLCSADEIAASVPPEAVQAWRMRTDSGDWDVVDSILASPVPPRAIELKGAPGGAFACANGVYFPTFEIAGGRAAYRKEGNSGICLSFCEDSARWSVCTPTDRGIDYCLIQSAVPTAEARDAVAPPVLVPEAVEDWEAGDGAPSEQATRAVVVSALPPRAVEIRGATGPYARHVNGVFRPCNGYSGAAFGGLCKYRKEGGGAETSLCFVASAGRWMVQAPDAFGGRGVFLRSMDGSAVPLTPEAVELWQIRDGENRGDDASWSVQEGIAARGVLQGASGVRIAPGDDLRPPRKEKQFACTRLHAAHAAHLKRLAKRKEEVEFSEAERESERLRLTTKFGAPGQVEMTCQRLYEDASNRQRRMADLEKQQLSASSPRGLNGNSCLTSTSSFSNFTVGGGQDDEASLPAWERLYAEAPKQRERLQELQSENLVKEREFWSEKSVHKNVPHTARMPGLQAFDRLYQESQEREHRKNMVREERESEELEQLEYESIHRRAMVQGTMCGGGETVRRLYDDAASRRERLGDAQRQQLRERAPQGGKHTLAVHEGVALGGRTLLAQTMTIEEAHLHWASVFGCKGFVIKGRPDDRGAVKVFFKSGPDVQENAGWTSFVQPRVEPGQRREATKTIGSRLYEDASRRREELARRKEQADAERERELKQESVHAAAQRQVRDPEEIEKVFERMRAPRAARRLWSTTTPGASVMADGGACGDSLPSASGGRTPRGAPTPSGGPSGGRPLVGGRTPPGARTPTGGQTPRGGGDIPADEQTATMTSPASSPGLASSYSMDGGPFANQSTLTDCRGSPRRQDDRASFRSQLASSLAREDDGRIDGSSNPFLDACWRKSARTESPASMSPRSCDQGAVADAMWTLQQLAAAAKALADLCDGSQRFGDLAGAVQAKIRTALAGLHGSWLEELTGDEIEEFLTNELRVDGGREIVGRLYKVLDPDGIAGLSLDEFMSLKESASRFQAAPPSVCSRRTIQAGNAARCPPMSMATVSGPVDDDGDASRRSRGARMRTAPASDIQAKGGPQVAGADTEGRAEVAKGSSGTGGRSAGARVATIPSKPGTGSAPPRRMASTPSLHGQQSSPSSVCSIDDRQSGRQVSPVSIGGVDGAKGARRGAAAMRQSRVQQKLQSRRRESVAVLSETLSAALEQSDPGTPAANALDQLARALSQRGLLSMLDAFARVELFPSDELELVEVEQFLANELQLQDAGRVLARAAFVTLSEDADDEEADRHVREGVRRPTMAQARRR